MGTKERRCGPAFLLDLSLLVLTVGSCKQAPPPDPLCSYEPLPESGQVPAGQGAIQILASTDDHFYVFDETGKQINHLRVNESLPLPPAKYQVKINNSAHAVVVQSKTLTKCSAGNLVAKGATGEHYYVFDLSGNQLSHEPIGKALALFPGKYQVRLNSSSVQAEVSPAATKELKPGSLLVSGTTGEHYYVFDPSGNQLAHEAVGRALGFFAGAYSVKVNGSETRAEIREGQPAELQTGTVVARGTTDEHYYVFNATGSQLAHNRLESPLALLPGTFTLKVNQTASNVIVAGGGIFETQTGTLLVRGTTAEHYYVFDNAGTQLAHNALGSPLSFMPGSYAVTVNNTRATVETKPGQVTEVQTGTLTVKGTGSEHYYVLDSTGNQLGHNALNQPLALLAGQYSVKVGQSSRPVKISSGQATEIK